MDSIDSLSHTTWRCKYHIVVAPKYRRQIIYGKLKTDIGKILRDLCARKEVEIIEANACADLDYRTTNGPFKSCQELTNVKGIGAKTVEKLLSVCVAEGGAAPAPVAPAPVAVQVAPQAAGGRVNINIASVNELAGMPGMSASKAAAAIEFRNANGPFATCQDLQKVKGIGVKTVEKLLSACTVE